MAIRTIEFDSVLDGTAVRDALLALTDEERAVVITRLNDPDELPVVALRGRPRGENVKLAVDFHEADEPTE